MRALILEHADHEGPGLLGAALEARGAAIDRRRLHRGDRLPEPSASPSIDGFDLVIAMGGPMSAWEDERWPFLAGEARLLAEAARAGRPTLGVCLGAQLLARGLGARVHRNAGPELGLAPIALTDDGRRDPLLAPLDGRVVLHWHGDTFALPEGAVHLARTALTPHQAFRFGARAWGVQFHVECDRAMRVDWAARGAGELQAAGVDPASLAGPDDLDERGRAFAERLLQLV